MEWGEDIACGFSPLGENEPAQLRRDITDELTDHLNCALRQELKRTNDESVARRVVLERFGDPQKLARRLWRDAMKETIVRRYTTKVVIFLLAIVGVLIAIHLSNDHWISVHVNPGTGQILPGFFDKPISITRDWQRAEPFSDAPWSLRRHDNTARLADPAMGSSRKRAKPKSLSDSLPHMGLLILRFSRFDFQNCV